MFPKAIAKKKICKVGRPCGFSCVPKNHNCKQQLKGDVKVAVEWLTNATAQLTKKRSLSLSPLTAIAKIKQSLLAENKAKIDKYTQKRKCLYSSKAMNFQECKIYSDDIDGLTEKAKDMGSSWAEKVTGEMGNHVVSLAERGLLFRKYKNVVENKDKILSAIMGGEYKLFMAEHPLREELKKMQKKVIDMAHEDVYSPAINRAAKAAIEENGHYSYVIETPFIRAFYQGVESYVSNNYERIEAISKKVSPSVFREKTLKVKAINDELKNIESTIKKKEIETKHKLEQELAIAYGKSEALEKQMEPFESKMNEENELPQHELDLRDDLIIKADDLYDRIEELESIQDKTPSIENKKRIDQLVSEHDEIQRITSELDEKESRLNTLSEKEESLYDDLVEQQKKLSERISDIESQIDDMEQDSDADSIKSLRTDEFELHLPLGKRNTGLGTDLIDDYLESLQIHLSPHVGDRDATRIIDEIKKYAF
jgi:hypothetical protein